MKLLHPFLASMMLEAMIGAASSMHAYAAPRLCLLLAVDLNDTRFLAPAETGPWITYTEPWQQHGRSDKLLYAELGMLAKHSLIGANSESVSSCAAPAFLPHLQLWMHACMHTCICKLTLLALQADAAGFL